MLTINVSGEIVNIASLNKLIDKDKLIESINITIGHYETMLQNKSERGSRKYKIAYELAISILKEYRQVVLLGEFDVKGD